MLLLSLLLHHACGAAELDLFTGRGSGNTHIRTDKRARARAQTSLTSFFTSCYVRGGVGASLVAFLVRLHPSSRGWKRTDEWGRGWRGVHEGGGRGGQGGRITHL